MKNAKHIFKTAIALTLVAIMLIAIPLSVSADTVQIGLTQCMDSNGIYMNNVANAYNHQGRLVCYTGEPIWKIFVGVRIEANLAYCIEPGSPLNNGNYLDSSTNEIWNSFSDDLKKSINIALLYGLNGSSDSLVGNTDEKYIATQLIIWELIDGYRNLWISDFKCTNPTYYNSVCNNGANPNVAENYNLISKRLESFNRVPSFTTRRNSNIPVLTLNWDGSNYTTTVEDKNKVLDEFDFKSKGLEIKAIGNKLTIISKNPISEAVTINSKKNIPEPKTAANLIAFGSDSRQDVIVGTSKSDPPQAYFSVKTTDSQLKIVKRDKETNETIPLEGFAFKISKENGEYIKDGNNDTFYSDVTGSVNVPVKLNPGVYYIEEVKTAGDYLLNSNKTKIEIDGTEPIVVIDFYNTVDKGSIKITKTGGILDSIKEVEKDGNTYKQPVWKLSGDETLDGAAFQLVAEEDIVTQDGTVRYSAGDVVVNSTSTNSQGILEFNNLYFGKYRIVETTVPYGYTPGEDVIVTVSKNDNSNLSEETIPNYKRRLKLRFDKQLEQDPANQVNIQEENLKVSFGLYANQTILANDFSTINKDELIDIAYADKDGKVIFNVFLPVGMYYVKELTTSEYYSLDDSKQPFTITNAVNENDETGLFKHLGTFTNDIVTKEITAKKSCRRY